MAREQSLTISVLQKSLGFFSAWQRKGGGSHWLSQGRLAIWWEICVGKTVQARIPESLSEVDCKKAFSLSDSGMGQTITGWKPWRVMFKIKSTGM